jgi:glycosyltransferase involved in cell wall biosynthesis
MRTADITPVVLTFNEAPNIRRTLKQLRWAARIVVVDSFSTDETCEIARAFPGVDLYQRRFDLHANQWNFAIRETAINTEWVLALDADYYVPEEFVRELQSLELTPAIHGLRCKFRYCVLGRPLRSAVYPPVTVLYRRTSVEYVQDGHTQRVSLKGGIADLGSRIFHDDRKPIGQWLMAQSRYMRLEAEKLGRARFSELSAADKSRRLIVVAPAAMFLYCLLVAGNILDGRAGLFYALQRTVAELILSLYLLERMASRGTS